MFKGLQTRLVCFSLAYIPNVCAASSMLGEDSKSSLPQSGRPGERRHAALPECSDIQPGGVAGETDVLYRICVI